MRLTIIKVFALLTFIFSNSTVAQKVDTTKLPTGSDWLNHTTNGLAPYWLMESAQGIPLGNFPTFRCDNGEVIDLKNVCRELKHGWMRSHYDREYTRMKSRQTFAYGVLYHLTGNQDALALAKSGAYYLINNLQDTKNGGFISFTVDGEPGLKATQRTSQDQAYALVGLAMYYYLTRDKLIEQALIKQQNHVFTHYRDDSNDELKWVIEHGDENYATQRELVAQLDQINGYMLLVAPILPKEYQQQWNDDLDWLTTQMIQHYYNAEENRFYGAVHSEAAMSQRARHNDFGHTIKAFWMSYLVGQYLENEEFIALGEQGMRATIKDASYTKPLYQLEDSMSAKLVEQWQDQVFIPGWISRPSSYGISSWEWAELDQAAMTLNMLDKSQVDKLFYTQQYYMDAWVDHTYGGVGLNPKSTKAFHWGNGYHQFEHALVGYISASQYYQSPAKLFYAIPSSDFNGAQLQPYYFKGKIQQVINNDDQQTVFFENISP